jgi:hypothetical protein
MANLDSYPEARSAATHPFGPDFLAGCVSIESLDERPKLPFAYQTPVQSVPSKSEITVGAEVVNG